MTTRPVLDYRPRLDPRNLAHRVTAAPDLTHVSRYWTPGVVVDQGQEGSCVGHGVVGEYLASPVRGVITGPNYTRPSRGHDLAVAVYNRAKEIDEYEGVNYDGTSVRAGMLVARERGWITGFKWALNMGELRTALEDGPVVVGVEWREGMYEAPDGTVKVTGDVVGGHCLIVTGYSPDWRGHGPHYRWLNSWGPSYGVNGAAYIPAAGLDAVLFKTGGEAAVAQGRHL